jgi:hypothetical protein
MFDDITYEAPCPICGKQLNGWQSKSAGCGLQDLTPSELWKQRRDDDSAHFYTGCRDCGTWMDITISPGLLKLTDEDYDLMRNRQPPRNLRGPVLTDDDKE